MRRSIFLASFGLILASIAGGSRAADGGDDPAGKLSLEVRVVGIDGEPVETSSILFWRLVPEAERGRKVAALWREPGTGAVWENIGGASTGDRLRRDDLAHGTYRVSAVQGHHQATPVGLSDPVVLDGDHEHAAATVRLRPGPTLTIRTVDAVGGEALLSGVSVGLSRIDADLPPMRCFSGKEEDGRITIRHLPPGTYRLQAYRRASGPEEFEYVAVEQDREVRVVAGVDQEIRVAMEGRPLTPAELEERWGWVAFGYVTDAEGRPIEGADVHVATGWGTLRGGGRTKTGEGGRFTLRFGEGVWSNDEANPQAAVFFVSRSGYVEKSRSRSGQHLMARRMPEEGSRYGAEPNEIILRGVPYRIDFVLTEPAILDVDLVGPADASLGVESVEPVDLGVSQSNERGGPGRWNLPPGRPWRFILPYRKTRFRVRSHPFTLPHAGRYRATLRYSPDPARGVDTLEFVGLSGPGGEDIIGRVVGDDPLARPPVSEALQRRGGEVLREMAAANRDWLGSTPEGVRTYEYRFRFAGEEGTTYRVGEEPVAGVVRRGISHYSAVHHLAAHPEEVTFRRVEIGDERVELTYTLREPIFVSAGDGVQKTWHGFFSMPAREGTLVLDARRHTPLEHRTEGLTETFSQYVEIGAGRFVPLATRLEQEMMRFDWTFQVVEPGLWLFAASHRGGAGEVAAVDRVKVNGAEAGVISRGRRPE